MKKIFYLMIMACSLLTAKTYGQGIDIGIKAGYNYSNFNANNVSADGRSGLMAGAYVKLKLTDKFAIQPELLFMQRGSTLTYNDATVKGTGNFKFNYIDVPVMFVFNPISVINIHFGPYASYLTNVNITSKTSDQYNFDQIKRSQFKDWDYGLAAGVGFDVLFLTGGIRYNMGFAKVGNGNGGYTFVDGNNRVTTLYVGVKF